MIPYRWQQLTALINCLKKFLLYCSVNCFFFFRRSLSSPPSKYYMTTTNFIFLRAQQLRILTILGCDRDLRFSAYRKIISMQFEEVILFVFSTFIAAYSWVIRFFTKETEPKPPSPSVLIIWYSPKLRLESKSSPLLTKSRSPFFKQNKSSSKYSTASQLNTLMALQFLSGQYCSIALNKSVLVNGLWNLSLKVWSG